MFEKQYHCSLFLALSTESDRQALKRKAGVDDWRQAPALLIDVQKNKVLSLAEKLQKPNEQEQTFLKSEFLTTYARKRRHWCTCGWMEKQDANEFVSLLDTDFSRRNTDVSENRVCLFLSIYFDVTVFSSLRSIDEGFGIQYPHGWRTLAG